MIEFLKMGGYAAYVWPSFGVTALLMVVEPILLGRRKAEILRRIRRLIRMNEARQS
jgi:heme exporter protein D